MTEKYTIPDGEPVDMSKVTLGPLYTAQDMYRDYPDLKLGDKIAVEKDGVIYTDTVQSVHYSSPEAEIWPHRSVWQRMIRALTPKRWRKPLQPIRPYKPATVAVGIGEDPLERAQDQIGKTLAWIEGLKRGAGG